MTIKARMGRGSKFGIKTSGDSYTYVGDLTTIGQPSPESEEIDVSTLDSPGTAKEFIIGPVDNGEFEISGNYAADDAGQDAVYNAFMAKSDIDFIIEVAMKGDETTAANMTGSGYVKNCTRMGNVEEGNLIPFTATIRVSGEISFTPALIGTVEDVEFTPDGGTFETSQSVTLACDTSGATIYYTADGTTPTTASTEYTGAISLTATTTIKAIAVKDGMSNSAVVSKTFTKTN